MSLFNNQEFIEILYNSLNTDQREPTYPFNNIIQLELPGVRREDIKVTTRQYDSKAEIKVSYIDRLGKEKNRIHIVPAIYYDIENTDVSYKDGLLIIKLKEKDLHTKKPVELEIKVE